jgi:hypothetical protein
MSNGRRMRSLVVTHTHTFVPVVCRYTKHLSQKSTDFAEYSWCRSPETCRVARFTQYPSEWCPATRVLLHHSRLVMDVPGGNSYGLDAIPELRALNYHYTILLGHPARSSPYYWEVNMSAPQRLKKISKRTQLPSSAHELSPHEPENTVHGFMGWLDLDLKNHRLNNTIYV